MATIQGVYLALFGRPADPTGLSFFNSTTKNGADLAGIGDLTSQAEYQTRFTGQSNAQIVASIYQSLFNRQPELAGLTFFVNALTNKTLTINNIAIAIYDGAQGADKTIRDLKEAAADAFTKAIDTAAEVIGYNGTAAATSARAFITGVTTTAPTAAAVDAAVAGAVTAGTSGTGGTGAILTLTAGADVVDPTQTNLSLKSTAGDDTIRAVTAGDLATTDVVNGGGGVDTLNATIGAGTIAAVITSVEKINLTGSGSATFDLGAVTGLADLTTTGGNFLTVANATASSTYGIKDGIGGADRLTVNYKDASGSNDTVKLVSESTSATNAVVSQYVVTNLENAAVTVVSDKVNEFHGIIFDATTSTLKAISLAGSGVVTLVNAANIAATLTTVDGSGLTGGLTFNADGLHTKIATVTGGSAADTLTLAAQTSVKVTGGAGADVINIGTGSATLVYKAGDSVLTSGSDQITNFTTGTDKIDLTGITLTNKTLGTSALATPAGDTVGLFNIGGTQFGVIKINGGTDIAVDVNNDGNYSAATDLYIKGVGTAVIGDFIFA